MLEFAFIMAGALGFGCIGYLIGWNHCEDQMGDD